LNIPGSIPKGLDKMKQEMISQGMDTNLYYYGGHSLGTVKIQDYCFEYKQNCTGQILMGGCLLRNASSEYFYDVNYPVPTLTIGGELDGLTRVTRMMEGYYHQVLHSKSQDFPIVVIEGMTHMQFASGSPPILVFEKDLKPEITYDQAHEDIGTVTAEWLDVQIKQTDSKVFDDYMKNTDTFLQPLLKAFGMESYYYFETPCYMAYPDAVDDASCCYSGGGCQCSNNWTPMSISWMADLPAISVVDSDVMHPVSQIPIHLPHVNNTCTEPDSTCTLLTSTVTENIYGPHQASDNPFYPLAATEMRTKLKSRQALQIAAGIADADFKTLDGTGTRCGELNQFVFNWALDLAGETSAHRYDKLGQRLVFGDDTMESSGWFWINTAMTYNQITLDGEKVIQINSTALASSVNFPQQNSAGMHYCKVLSPAYAIEWIYVDGLRLNDGLSS